MANLKKGAKEIQRMKGAAQAAAPKVTDDNFAAGAHPNRGEIADGQVDIRDSRQSQKALSAVIAKREERREE